MLLQKLKKKKKERRKKVGGREGEGWREEGREYHYGIRIVFTNHIESVKTN